MSTRLPIMKTWKMYVGGAFPRSESGRTLPVVDGSGRTAGHACRASRKDLRDAVRVADGAQAGWAARAAYNRGQILYRMAEMLEGKRSEMVEALTITGAVAESQARREVEASVDRLVAFAGWTDKLSQVLGCCNAVNGPYYVFTAPEPTGVVVAVCGASPGLLGLVSLVAPALCAGNAVVAVAGPGNPVPASVLGEVCATSDVPAGVLNILTGDPEQLASWIAEHRGIAAVTAANVGDDVARTLRGGASENVKRVRTMTVNDDEWYDNRVRESPWVIEPLVEMKTVWHPAGV